MKFPIKRIALFVALAVVALVIVSVVRGMMMQDSLGLSGTTSTSGVAMAPGFYANPAPNSFGMNNVRQDGVSLQRETASSMPTPVQGGDAPAGASKIIRNAELTLLVDNIDTTAQMIDHVRVENGGQVGNASFSHYTSSRTGDITVWIPSDHFDAALASIKSGALRVTNERITVSDVSAQFVDLEARLKNMHATEAQYLEIMKRSGSISDILNVTRELSQTRQMIEQLQGQLNYLSRQVDLSSIHITLTEEVTPTLSKDEWRPLSVIKTASRETLRGLTNFIDMLLVLLVRLPLLLLQCAFWGGILYGLWRVALFAYVRMKVPRLPS